MQWLKDDRFIQNLRTSRGESPTNLRGLVRHQRDIRLLCLLVEILLNLIAIVMPKIELVLAHNTPLFLHELSSNLISIAVWGLYQKKAELTWLRHQRIFWQTQVTPNCDLLRTFQFLFTLEGLRFLWDWEREFML